MKWHTLMSTPCLGNGKNLSVCQELIYSKRIQKFWFPTTYRHILLTRVYIPGPKRYYFANCSPWEKCYEKNTEEHIPKNFDFQKITRITISKSPYTKKYMYMWNSIWRCSFFKSHMYTWTSLIKYCAILFYIWRNKMICIRYKLRNTDKPCYLCGR